MTDPIWQILKHQGRSLKWLAGRVRFNYPYVRAIAAGIEEPSSDFRMRCANVLDIPVELLFLADRSMIQRRFRDEAMMAV